MRLNTTGAGAGIGDGAVERAGGVEDGFTEADGTHQEGCTAIHGHADVLSGPTARLFYVAGVDGIGDSDVFGDERGAVGVEGKA